jgi:pimeloyl-ACP methyl ester carboxylesterase
MIRQAVPRRGPSRRGPPRHRPDWPAIDRLVAQYGNIDVPVTITFGEHDEAMPAAMSYKLARQIPGAKLEPLPHCMHSPHLECPVELAGIIRRSIGAAPAPPDRFSAP